MSDPPSRMVIGLTGPIAAGKSTVAAIMGHLGAEVIDADQVYRELLVPGSDLLRAIAAEFGQSVIRHDGQLDRAALAQVVFNDPEALQRLDRLSHPAVVAEVRRRIERSDSPVVVVEAVKLVQSGLADDVDQLWVVDAPREVRLRRLIARGGIDRDSAEQRIESAVDPTLANVDIDAVIDASCDIEDTTRTVVDMWNRLGTGPVVLESDVASARSDKKHEVKC